jgi:phenylalanyl-tRNA synthetase beta chain
VVKALNRAAQLIADLSGGSICRNCIDEYPQKVSSAKNIPLRLKRIRQIIGTDIRAKDVIQILRQINMHVQPDGKGKYLVTPPTCRVDISREVDLIEEIIRLYGYDKVPMTLPNVSVMETEFIPRLELEEKLRQLMVGSGFTEIVNYSFESPLAADILLLPEKDPRRNFIKINNPLGEELSAMRTTIIHGLLDTVNKNANNGSYDLKIFEMGRIFLHRKNGELPEEVNVLSGLITGKITDDFWNAGKSADFYTLKGCLENIFYDLKMNHCKYVPVTDESFLHPGKASKILLNEKTIGIAGEVHPDINRKYDFKNNVYVFDINMDNLIDAYKESRVFYRELSKYPAVTRDAAFVIPEITEADEMINAVLGQREDLLENVSVFDVYKGKGIPERTKSLGLRFSYRAADRTLTDEEISKMHDRLVQKTVDLTGAKIRS